MATKDRSGVLRSGILLILLSMSLTPLGDAISKHLASAQPPVEIVFLRYLAAGLIGLCLILVRGRGVHLQRQQFGGLILRTFCVMAAMSLLAMALALVPLAVAVGGFLIAPLVAVLISIVLYGERLTVPRATGAAFSFLGALAILRPEAGISPGALAALGGGGMLGVFLALTRGAGAMPDALAALTVQCLLGAFLVAPIAVLGGLDFTLVPVLPALGLGLVTAATHFLTVAAYQRAEAGLLAPFFYFSLVAALAIGLVWFEEFPDAQALVGLGAILTGGLISLVPVGRFARRRSAAIRA